ncbi:MAG: hypothetical protein QOI80_2685 [Solirubrobacteraceae bacterium]|nr:hypothetical protein [Solirubrobacteraceae bacterium]
MRAYWIALTLAVVPATPAGAMPHCFGAAARDPEHPCVNHRLDSVAIPSPDAALLQPSAPCRVVRRTDPAVCAFGRSDKTATVALLGDSHAVHWRAALTRVARAERWRGMSITRTQCPFTLARKAHGACRGFARRTLRWLGHHRSIRTVFVSANDGVSLVAPRATYRETQMREYMRAWAALPPTVHEVYVLRDVPEASIRTAPCVKRAVAHHRTVGVACARPRSHALKTDYEAVAAARYAASPYSDHRVRLIDLAPFMCDDRRCFPVVGGALVIKDRGHLTRTFSATLGPYLRRAVERLRQAGQATPP